MAGSGRFGLRLKSQHKNVIKMLVTGRLKAPSSGVLWSAPDNSIGVQAGGGGGASHRDHGDPCVQELQPGQLGVPWT